MKYFVVTFQAVGEPGICERLDSLLGSQYKVVTWAGGPGLGWYVVGDDGEASAADISSHLASALGDAEGPLTAFVVEMTGSWDALGVEEAVKEIGAVVPRG